MPDIRDIADPTPFLPAPSTPWWHWALALGAVFTILTFLVYFWLKKRQPARRKRTLLDKARAKLHTLRHEAETLPLHTIATRISIIIRTYLEQAFDDPALFETDEEFTLRPGALKDLPTATREQVQKHLHDLTYLKYAPHQSEAPSPDDSLIVVKEAEDLIAQLERTPSPQKPTLH